MGRNGRLLFSLFGILLFLMALGLFGLTRDSIPVPVDQRADLIRIALTTGPDGSALPVLPGGEGKQMPAVYFFHDLHTRSLPDDTCHTCHPTGDDHLAFLFKRLEIGDPGHDREIYHTNCIGCHTDQAAAGSSYGPLNGDCRGCHSQRDKIASSWVPLTFSPSLHDRHESADLIPPDAGGETRCGACHHQYDAATRKTTYIQGEEDSCRYCHPAPGIADGVLKRPHRFATFTPRPDYSAAGPTAAAGQTETSDRMIRPMSAAAHDACVACHHRLTETHQLTTGPLDCAGCHTVQAQKNFPVPETVPRIKRNQPDTVLMAAWVKNDVLSPSMIAGEVNPVAFDHKGHEIHEAHSASCRRCHHSALKACGDCHTRGGASQGEFIDLNQAMHNLESVVSCLGCHRDRTAADTDCAGCHAVRPRSGFGDQDCRICHAVEKTDISSLPLSEQAGIELAAEILAARRDARRTMGSLPPTEQIPERVSIDALLDTYEAVDLPHRKIVLELNRRIQSSGLARAFHSEPLTLCAGCHHHSPATVNPPKCISCHSRHQQGPDDGRPALMGAYHNQCLGCHRRMGIEKPQATACTECHPKRDQQQRPDVHLEQTEEAAWRLPADGS